jgi:hypothetical protein
VAATAAGAEAMDRSGLPRRLAADRRRCCGRGRRAPCDGVDFVGVTFPAPGLGDGAFVGVLDTMGRALLLLDLSADG